MVQKVLRSEHREVVGKLIRPTSLATPIKRKKPNLLNCTTSRTTQLSFTIAPSGPDLLIRIRGIKILIVDQKMDEDLLGRPFSLRHQI